MKMHIIYELQDENGSPIYIGSTNNLRRRINEHRKSKTGFCLKNNMIFYGFKELERVQTKKEGLLRESLYHDFYKTLGFLIAGQSAGKRSAETLIKITNASKKSLKESNEKRKVKVIDSNGVIYDSIRDCATALRKSAPNISMAVSGKIKKCSGLTLRRLNV